MRNEKLEMRKWKRKWKWSSLLLVDNTEVDAIVYGVSKGRYRSLVVYYEIGVPMHVYPLSVT